jgi:hypothetical protein
MEWSGVVELQQASSQSKGGSEVAKQSAGFGGALGRTEGM